MKDFWEVMLNHLIALLVVWMMIAGVIIWITYDVVSWLIGLFS